MDVIQTIKVILAGLGWRVFGISSSGRALLDAFDRPDEQARTIAGIALVRAGARSVNLIGKAINTGSASPDAVRLLASIGGPAARAVLERAGGSDSEIAVAATETLAQLNRIEAAGGAGGAGGEP